MTAAHSLRECPQQFEDVGGKAANLAPQVDWLYQNATAVKVAGDPEEMRQCAEFAGYVR